MLARRRKFSKEAAEVDVAAAKKISLRTKRTGDDSDGSAEEKREKKPTPPAVSKAAKKVKVSRLVSEEAGDAISLSVTDTLDMFDEEEEEGEDEAERDKEKTRRQGNET